jgi:hypothetical protein
MMGPTRRVEDLQTSEEAEGIPRAHAGSFGVWLKRPSHPAGANERAWLDG